jgi:hypothetical protein
MNHKMNHMTEFKYHFIWLVIILTFLVELFILYLILTGRYASPLCLVAC